MTTTLILALLTGAVGWALRHFWPSAAPKAEPLAPVVSKFQAPTADPYEAIYETEMRHRRQQAHAKLAKDLADRQFPTEPTS